MPALPSHAGIMPPVTEKNLFITGFLDKFYFIQNQDLKNWNLASSKIRIDFFAVA